MSIWGDPEIVKVDGEYKAFVKVQNDWSGDVRGHLRDIHMDKDGRYYCRADGSRCDVTRIRERYIKQEQDIKSAVDYAKEHRGF